MVSNVGTLQGKDKGLEGLTKMITTHFLIVMNSGNPGEKPRYKLCPTEELAAFYCHTLPPTIKAEIEMVSEETE